VLFVQAGAVVTDGGGGHPRRTGYRCRHTTTSRRRPRDRGRNGRRRNHERRQTPRRPRIVSGASPASPTVKPDRHRPPPVTRIGCAATGRGCPQNAPPNPLEPRSRNGRQAAHNVAPERRSARRSPAPRSALSPATMPAIGARAGSLRPAGCRVASPRRLRRLSRSRPVIGAVGATPLRRR
jgi:hypothetical protein